MLDEQGCSDHSLRSDRDARDAQPTASAQHEIHGAEIHGTNCLSITKGSESPHSSTRQQCRVSSHTSQLRGCTLTTAGNILTN